jgi:hypothetical protein
MVIRYNLYTHKIQYFNAATTLFKKEINPLDLSNKPMDIQKKIEHLTASPLYENIYYDSYKRLYYRLCRDGIDKRRKDGTYTSFEDKPLIIAVFDESFHLIAEKNLASDKYGNFGYVNKDGLHLYKNKITKDYAVKLYFDRITVQ